MHNYIPIVDHRLWILIVSNLYKKRTLYHLNVRNKLSSENTFVYGTRALDLYLDTIPNTFTKTNFLMSGDEEQNKKEIPLLKPSTSSVNVPQPWENQNHPLFLHHSDQPGAILVPQPLVEDDYADWSQSMSSALKIKNKHGFIDGSIKRPTEGTDEQNQWDRCDTLVKTWLRGSMSKEIRKSVAHCKDARTVWLELEERFSQVNTC